MYKFSCKNGDIAFRSKFLTSRTEGHFRKNFTLVIFLFIFIFYWSFHLLQRPLNTLSRSFQAKMETLHSGWNFWAVETGGIFVQILHKFFFSFERIVHIFWTTKNAICKFWRKNVDIVFQSKFLTSWTQGHFRNNFIRIIFLFIFHFYWIFQFFS